MSHFAVEQDLVATRAVGLVSTGMGNEQHETGRWSELTGEQIKFFFAVVEKGSLAAAAKHLRLSETRKMRLELARLAALIGGGEALFVSRPGARGGTVLTATGDRLRPHLDHLRSELMYAESTARMTGPLRVWHLPHHTLITERTRVVVGREAAGQLELQPRVLGEDFRSRPKFTKEVLWPLYEGRCDVAVGLGKPEVVATEHRVRDDDDGPLQELKDVFLYEARLELMALRDDKAFRDNDYVTLERLQGLELLTPKKDTRSRSNLDLAVAERGLDEIDAVEEYESKVLYMRQTEGHIGYVVLPSDAAVQFERLNATHETAVGWGPLAGARAAMYRWIPLIKDPELGLEPSNFIHHPVRATYRLGNFRSDAVRKVIDTLGDQARNLLREHNREVLTTEIFD